MSPVITDVQVKRNGVAAITISTSVADGDRRFSLTDGHAEDHAEDHADNPGVDGDAERDSVILPLETVVLHHLRRGNDLTPEEWATARDEGRRLLAVRRALDLLARRLRTRQELQRALVKSFTPDEATHAVERMSELGYLDDAAWADNFVRSPRASGRGRAMLKRELTQRGIDQSVAAVAVDEHDERAAAEIAARKRVRSLRRVEEPKRSRRLYDFLRRRGFADPVARAAAATALAEIEEGSGASLDDATRGDTDD